MPLAGIIHFILQLIVFGIGASVRYVFFFIVGRKKAYDDLIAPSSQDKWNVLVGFVLAAILIYFALQFKPPHRDYRHPPDNYRYIRK